MNAMQTREQLENRKLALIGRLQGIGAGLLHNRLHFGNPELGPDYSEWIYFDASIKVPFTDEQLTRVEDMLDKAEELVTRLEKNHANRPVEL